MTTEPATSYEQILVERHGRVEVITLNRPERLNAWTWKMGAELEEAIEHANDDDGVGCIVVTGAFNIPRNNALDKLSPTTTESAAYWTSYLSEWTTWNHVRTAACIAAMVCFVLAVQ